MQAVVGGLLVATAVMALADPLVDQETRAASGRSTYGVTGKGVAVAVFDRGIDYTHPDFRHADGSTRIAYILDLTDSSGASAPGNTAGIGTLYTAAQINAALSAGTRLATRDAVGHGTATAGNCCGNGRASNGLYTGIAPESTLIIVKFTTEGAPAHGSEPAEPAFYQAAAFDKAVDFAVAKAAELGMPLVMLANFGSIGDRADGTDAFSTKIDATVGPGKAGRAFVTGVGDDGGRNNHAAGTVAAGQNLPLQIQKGASNLLVQIWYPGSDRFAVTITTPTGSSGPYAPPAHNASDTRSTAEFSYGHNGGVYYSNGMRLIYATLSGPAGTYTITLNGATVTSGSFHAYLSPAHFSTAPEEHRFLNLATPASTIWPGATARQNIAPGSYVLRTSWRDLDGVTRGISGEGDIGDLWRGSSIGPTWDGRNGVDLVAPGDRNITAYSTTSYWGTFRFNMVSDGGGLYGMAGAVSAAAPLVAGTVALMLQRNPGADAPALKSALQRSARVDGFTGAVPNTRFGFGKLDVQGALAAIGLAPIPASVSDCLFNWAERSYAQYFNPPGAPSQTLAPYYYRHYPATNNYLGVSSDDNQVWLLGPVVGGGPAPIGPVSNFRAQAGC
ncbi:MAG: S8 family serine peptidase [Rubrivivax sp.]